MRTQLCSTLIVLLCVGLPLRGLEAADAAGPSRPNILWITAEDINANLGCYNDPVARTPNLDLFARAAVRYTHAFATAPVCSPARSCLITGMYATSLGTEHLRSRVRIPPEFKGFPAYLREAGYFCSNNVKTDYNLDNEAAFIRGAWDRSDTNAHWRQRQPGQPFFSVFNLMTTHQTRTSVWSWDQFEQEVGAKLKPEERTDPAKVPVPPYYPDTPLARRTLARYYDCICAMDKEVARILAELDADGLAENTIVFFFGDNGAGLPRHKRLLHDSGMRVPLLIRFPKKFQSLAPSAPGKFTDRLVSFVDFAPTILSLCGAKVPSHMQGQVFLGPNSAKPRGFVYGARDRVDEAFDLSRMVRDPRWLYIRNHMPHLSWNQPEGFSDQSEFRREITRLGAEGRLKPAQMTYARPRKPIEELYDSRTDPHQIHNLAQDPRHLAVLERMRKLQRTWLIKMFDLSFMTEEQVAERIAGQPPFELRRQPGKYPLGRLLAAADLVGQPEAVPRDLEFLRDRDGAVRHWAAVGLRAAGKAAAPARGALVEALKDSSISVRIEAAGALAALDERSNTNALEVLVAALNAKQPEAAVHAARTLQLLGEKARSVLPAMQNALAAAELHANDDDHSLFISFALGAATRKLAEMKQVP